jgi:hypothetical protein
MQRNIVALAVACTPPYTTKSIFTLHIYTISLRAPSLARRPRHLLVCTRGAVSVDAFDAPAALCNNDIIWTRNVGQCQRKLKDTIVNGSVMI